MARINAKYNIVDCECYGDIMAEKLRLLSYPSVVIKNTYWDKKDCGEAYIEFSILEKHFPKLYFQLHDATFEANINDYISLNDKFAPLLKQYQAPFLNKNNFRLKREHKFHYLIKDVINYQLLLDITNLSETQLLEVIQNALNAIGKGAHIIAYNISYVDSNIYLTALIDGAVTEYDYNKIKSFGSCSIANYGTYLGKLNIYGQLQVNSVLASKKQDYKIFHDIIYNKEAVTYKHYNHFVDIPYYDCIDADGYINEFIQYHNHDYVIV